ncbi:MAG: copper homeostasis periplasmic binding protein CopC [Novosphingobium sp.]
MSKVRISAAIALATGIAMAMGVPAQAHPRLIGANPSPNSVVAAPRSVQLRFNEQLVRRFTGADILRKGGAGQAPSKLPGTRVSLEADGKTLTVMPGRPLAAGTYQLMWRAVSVDTHRVSGSYDFRVR